MAKLPRVSLLYSQRKIVLYDDIDEDSAFEFTNCVNILIYLDNKLGEKKPIEILINSGGGLIYSGITIISLIEQLKKQGYEVTTVNTGICASMAFVISICGSKRCMYENAVYMYHDASSGTFGKLENMKDDVRDMQKLRDTLDEIVLRYTNVSKENIQEWHDRKFDRYFYKDEALSLKICDFVL